MAKLSGEAFRMTVCSLLVVFRVRSSGIEQATWTRIYMVLVVGRGRGRGRGQVVQNWPVVGWTVVQCVVLTSHGRVVMVVVRMLVRVSAFAAVHPCPEHGEGSGQR